MTTTAAAVDPAVLNTYLAHLAAPVATPAATHAAILPNPTTLAVVLAAAHIPVIRAAQVVATASATALCDHKKTISAADLAAAKSKHAPKHRRRLLFATDTATTSAQTMAVTATISPIAAASTTAQIGPIAAPHSNSTTSPLSSKSC